MPENLTSYPEARCSALEEFVEGNPRGAGSSGVRCPSRMAAGSLCNPCDDHHLKPVHTSPPSRQRGRRPKPHVLQPPPRTGRRPGTSQYYGVRFRPDLNKWVAEIRVAEWKAVDKKVWLGTFETEQAAARGVDLARKLLKCTKKHRPNLPCPELEEYATTIPRNLILTNLNMQSMFKEATSFIKKECKLYAASFSGSGSTSTSTTTTLGYNPSTALDDSEFIEEYNNGAMATNDALLGGGFEVDYPMTLNYNHVYNHNYELVVSSSSSPSSCTSPGSCVTLGPFQGSDYGDAALFQCCRDIPVLMPEVEGMVMMESGQVDASAASQQWGEDENPFFPWPGHFPQDSPSAAFLNQMPAVETDLQGWESI